MRANLSGIAALCLGALSVWSCAGEVGPNDSIDSPGMVGAKGGANGGPGGRSGGGAGQPAGGAPAQPAAGTSGQSVSGGAGQPAGGAPGQPAAGTSGQPAGGAPGQPASGGTGQPAGGAGGSTAPPATSAAATIVPLYTSPSHASWNAVIDAKMAHPTVGVTAIVNPSNGPGSAVSSAYASGIARLTAAGIKVIGYVATGYTGVASATVKADIDRWRTFYPGQITGIFFDEQSNKAGDVPYYRELSQYSKAQGLSFTVGNPGTDTAEGYVGALDMMLIYESAGVPGIDRLAGWHANHAPSNFGVIPYATSMSAAFVRDARRYVQYIYLQNDNLPNPWDSVPPYFSDLLAALE